MLLEVLTMMAACVEDEPSHYTRIVAGRRRLGEAGDAFAKPALIPARPTYAQQHGRQRLCISQKSRPPGPPPSNR
ncbi:hypothetical protein, partial [Burkholderia gladioli]|uniref:hypothetical protein n=1 Tax=Burkholderia gladioli TaxID=28095 RepID=UPI001C61150C